MLKLISINIERDRHYDTVIPFIKSEAPDILCLQEVFQEDIHMFEESLNMKSFVKPMCHYKTSDPRGEESKTLSIAILTKFDADFSFQYIIGDDKNIPNFARPKDPNLERNTINVLLMWAQIKDLEGKVYRIANTHFTWTPEGLSTQYQKEDMAKLIAILDTKVKDFVLVGDLNAPRGKETFTMLESKYKDNIPAEYVSSIDPKLHRVSGLSWMVDCLFSTPEYQVKEAKLVEGVSDHKAVVACIETAGVT